MTVKTRRVLFALFIAALTVLLYFTGSPYVLCILVLLVLAASTCAALVRRDASRLSVHVSVPSGGSVGQPIRLTVTSECSGTLLGAKYALVNIEIHSAMFGFSEYRSLKLPLRNASGRYEAELNMEVCGEICFRCAGVSVWDLLELTRVRLRDFQQIEIIIYPKHINIDLAVSRVAVGSTSSEGQMQNRKGSDHSEMFDMREYVPGDDIRSIHWKLSCKTDALMVRQPSDPAHYDAVILPDIGLLSGNAPISKKELNGAVSMVYAIGEQLLRLGIAFCLAVPSNEGISLVEIRSQRELDKEAPRWMGLRVRPKSGDSLHFFQSQRLERGFTRMIIVCPGQFSGELTGLEKRIGISVVSAVDTDKPSYAVIGTACEAAVIPADPSGNEVYRIIC